MKKYVASRFLNLYFFHSVFIPEVIGGLDNVFYVILDESLKKNITL